MIVLWALFAVHFRLRMIYGDGPGSGASRATVQRRMGKDALIAVIFLLGFSAALPVATWLDHGRREKEERIIEGQKQVFRRYLTKVAAITEALGATEVRLQAMGIVPDDARREAMAEFAKRKHAYPPLEPVPDSRQLTKVRWAGYWKLPVIAALWLALGATYLLVLQNYEKVRAEVLGVAAPDGSRSRGMFGLATGCTLWLLAGIVVVSGAKMEQERYQPWSSALKLEPQRAPNMIAERWQIDWMIGKADEMAAQNGVRVISPEQRRAFLEATAKLPKCMVVLVVNEGSGNRHRARVEAGLAPRKIAIQSLLYEAGFCHAGSPSGDPHGTIKRVLEILERTGIAPGARTVAMIPSPPVSNEPTEVQIKVPD